MRLFVSVLATTAMFFVGSTASALEFSVISPTTLTVAEGDQFTIEIVITNADVASIDSIGASVTGYGSNVFNEGTAVGQYLDFFCQNPTTCFGGIGNLAGPDAAGAPVRDLAETTFGGNPNRVQFALSAATAPVNGATGSADLGLDGGVGTAQFTVTFTATQSATILVGTAYQGDGFVSGGVLSKLGDTEINLTVVPIPEPGTALLMGLGLAGLAAAGRRE